MRWRGGLAILMCALAALACNLTFQEDETIGTTQTQVASVGGAPSVQIVSPSNGQQVRVDDDVEIIVSATDAVGVNRLQLTVSGRTSSTKSFPEPATTAEAILRWRPDRTGTFELSVIAFRGRVFSEPVTLSLQVLRRDDALQNPASGQQQVTNATSGSCNGRILINNLRQRGGPGTNFDNLGNFDLNEQVTVIGQNADNTWLNARRLGGSEVWVINNPEWIEISGACSGLPVNG